MFTRRRSIGLLAGVAVVLSALAAAPGAQAEDGSLGDGAVRTAQTKIVSDNPVGRTPHVLDGRVDAVAKSGDTMILGGEFTTVASPDRSQQYSRTNIVAFSASTGQISQSFVPKLDGKVTSLQVSPDGASVFAGGFFNTVNGKASKSLAKISLANGDLATGFTAPKLNGRVKDLKLQGERLWIAGTFGYVADKKQAALATISARTGAFDSYNRMVLADPYRGGALQVLKIDLNPAQDKLIAIGNFGTVQGQSRPQIAMLDLGESATGLADWQTTFYQRDCSLSFDSYMRDLSISPDGKYVVVVTTGAWRGVDSPCDTSARFEVGATGTGLKPTWIDFSGGDTMTAVTTTGSAVYVGGHFRWQNNGKTPNGDSAGPGAFGRSGITALDPANGLPFRWNPGRTLGVGVFDLLATDDGLWVTSDTDRIGHGEFHGRNAFFPLEGGTSVPYPATGLLPGTVYLGSSGQLVKRTADGTSFGPDQSVPSGNVDWSRTRGSFMLGSQLFLGHTDGAFTRRSFTGSTYGDPTAIDASDQLVRDSAWHTEVSRATGMARSGGRLYYTLPGDANLYYRYYSVESDAVGSLRYTADTSARYATVAGMFVQPGKLYWGSSLDRNLRSGSFVGGKVDPGSIQVVSGPNTDQRTWRSPSTFVFAPAEGAARKGSKVWIDK